MVQYRATTLEGAREHQGAPQGGRWNEAWLLCFMLELLGPFFHRLDEVHHGHNRSTSSQAAFGHSRSRNPHAVASCDSWCASGLLNNTKVQLALLKTRRALCVASGPRLCLAAVEREVPHCSGSALGCLY